MYLYELFGSNELTDSLKQAVLDYLTPLVAQSVPFVTIQSVVDQLRKLNSGLNIDRGFVMRLLNGNVNFVTKIEGDRIYISKPQDDQSQEEKDDQNNIEKVKQNAIDQAQKNVKQEK